MSTATVGQVVDITRRWGRQVRQKCVTCTKFFTGETCKHCGTQYRPVGDDRHEIVSLPA